MPSIAIIGAGSWGTGLSVLLSHNNHQITVWTHSQEEALQLNACHEHKQKLPGVMIPQEVCFTNDMDAALEGAELIVFVVPSQTIRSNAKLVAKSFGCCKKNVILVCCSKGLEEGTGKRLSAVLQEELPLCEVVGLYGPSHAEEVVEGEPTTVVAASVNREAAELVQDAFMTNTFRVYTSSDIIGAEIGSAVKNVIAICAGICDGLGFGDNSRAALMTRGITEIARLGVALGGNADTFSGLTGIGDLIVTCTSKHSRNWNAGYLIGKGSTLAEATDKIKMVVEGVSATKAVKKLANETSVHMPIAEEAYAILFEGKNPKIAVHDLMTRSKKHETEEPGW